MEGGREGGREGRTDGGREGRMEVGRDRGRGGERERERQTEDHGAVTPTGGSQSEILIPSHSHITNNSIYCRYKLTWSSMC